MVCVLLDARQSGDTIMLTNAFKLWYLKQYVGIDITMFNLSKFVSNIYNSDFTIFSVIQRNVIQLKERERLSRYSTLCLLFS